MTSTIQHEPIDGVCGGTDCGESCPYRRHAERRKSEGWDDVKSLVGAYRRAGKPKVSKGLCAPCEAEKLLTAQKPGRRVIDLGNGRTTFVDELATARVPGPPIPYGQPVVRHLAYHVAPFSGNGVWRRNVEQLVKRIDLFNGSRIVAVVTGQGLDPPDAVRRAFAGSVEDFVVLPNVASLGEVVTFLPMMERQPAAPHDATFYAHAKGVRRPGEPAVHRWADLMYETCLDYWPLVERLLLDHAMAGSFKKVGMGFGGGSRSSWHYSGTFFWVRNSAVLADQRWRAVDQQWAGVEAWPGVHVAADDAACVFHEGTVPSLNMYSEAYQRAVVEPQYASWKRQNEGEKLCVYWP